jgi:endonuclease YncB( thermonuclease family)
MHKILDKLREYLLELVILIFAGASLFFITGAQLKLHALKESNPEQFMNEDKVTIVKIVDGDEIRLLNSRGNYTLLRLLGIKSFDPGINDPLLAQTGSICFNYLSEAVEGKSGHIILEDKKIDDKGRLLGYLFVDEEKESYDVGKRLLERGHACVYTEFDFGKMEEYKEAELLASEQNLGLWSSPSIRNRVIKMQQIWNQKRTKK